MTITVQCPSCGVKLRIGDQHAGKRARCQRCNEEFAVPAGPPADRAVSGPVSLEGEPRQARDAHPVTALKPQPADEDDTGGYLLADQKPKKVKAVRARQERLTGVGASARGVMEAAAATRKTLTPAQILSAFGGEIEPVRPAALYRIWVAIVAVVMVLLPLVYLAIIGLVVAGLVYHAVHNVTVFQHLGRGRGSARGAALIYLAPLLAGAVVVLFMLKPLFARAARREKLRVLEPQVEPLLHAFVDGVCASVGAPRPNRIEVNCDVNAGARRAGPLRGILGNELVLLIGLPLAAGLTLKQFAGVLAHEFGHFSQGAGMRLYVLIMTINMWFARAVYERDGWDEALVAYSKGGNIYTMILAGLCRLAVWLTRRILWVLMWVGHAVSASLSRQMETDADRYEARMVGGNEFAETMWRLHVMSLANQGAYADLASSWEERRMPDNFAKLLLANIPQIPKELVAAHRAAMDQGSTGLLDLYPCIRERIAQAQREEPGAGIFHLDGPATDVFSDFDAMAKVVSLDLYKSMVGPGITKDQLYAVEELVEIQVAAQEGQAAAERFLLGSLDLLATRLPLPRDYPALPADPALAKRALVEARTDLQGTRAARQKAIERTDEVVGRLRDAEYAQLALKAGIQIDPAGLDLKAATPVAVQAARDQAEGEVRRIVEECGPFARAAARRLTQGLAILEADLIAERIAEGRELREEARTLYPCAAHLASVYGPLATELFLRQTALDAALHEYQSAAGKNDEKRIKLVRAASAALADQLERLRRELGDTMEYPFDHAQEGITLARFAIPTLPADKDDVGGVRKSSETALGRLHGLYCRALGRLAVTVEEVERVLGLPAIAFEEEDGELLSAIDAPT